MRLRDKWNSIYANLRTKWSLARLVWRHDPTYVQALFAYFDTALGGDQSRKRKIPTTDSGEALPWYTYPAITYLSQLDFSRCAIFEYGAGNSSSYWARRAESVVSVESDPQWYETVREMSANNQKLMLCVEMVRFTRAIHETMQTFDVVVIDAGWRYNCAQEALGCLKPDGLFILDNSDWYPNTSALLRNNGFQQIDFAGWSPLNPYASCTSIFIRGKSGIPRYPVSNIQVPGGQIVLAEDDKQL